MPNRGHETGVGRGRLLLVVAIFVAPMVAAMAWYALAPRLAPSASAHGTLVQPARPLAPFEIARDTGDPYTLADLRGHWTMVVAPGAGCSDRCRTRLHETRQIHRALGDDRNRVRRIALAAEGRRTPGLQRVLDEHPDLIVLAQHPDGALMRQLPAAPDGTVFLIDPLGNLMMRFGPAIEADGILDDLEHLLSVSQIG